MEDKKIITSPDVIMTELEDEGVLLNLETKTYYTLNKPGVYVWDLIKEGFMPSEIVKRVKDEFSVEKEVAERKVNELFDELIKENLIQVID